MKKFRRKITGFVSEIDQFLQAFNKKHKRSHAQQAEYEKHQRIYDLRDNAQKEKKGKKIWEKF